MKIFCKELNKSFDNDAELFKSLKESEFLIVDAKKAEVYKSIEKGLEVVTNQKQIEKAINQDAEKTLKFDDNYYYFVVNSANYLDSHKDVHLDGNWNKSVKESQGKCYLVFDHSLKRGDVIAMKKDIEMLTAKLPWSSLGKNYEGETYCLVYKVEKTKIVNKEAKEWLESGHELEASVRMQYVKIDMAFNSNDADYVKEKLVYDEVYPLIANKADFKDLKYFFSVREAKNVLESSLVLFGSNGATGQVNENKEQAEESLVEIPEAVVPTLQEEKNYIYQ